MKTRTHHRGAFTLVEVLTVIAIIGLLVGLLVPAIGYALRRVKQNAIAMEVVTLADAVEKYNSKFGDYPPDGSDANIVKRHLLKLFPQIASSEFRDLDFAANCNQYFRDASQQPAYPSTPTAESRVMDPTEALVFFLGGYSADPQHPLTGAGGPLSVISRDGSGNATAIEYNVDRTNSFYEFKQSQLTLVVANGATISNDETLYDLPGPPDALPSYHLGGQQSPFVYFDSRTYTYNGTSFPSDQVVHFSPGPNSPVSGFARPYKSLDVKTTVRPQIGDAYYRYMNPQTFQLISAGLDESFGGINPIASANLFHAYPSGQQIDIRIPGNQMQPGPSRYQNGDGPSAQLDNVANFSSGIFEDQLE